jgi:hypothetical protein
VLLSFLQIYILPSYDSISDCLTFRTLYSRRRHLDTVFLINVVKGKINYHSIMGTIGTHVSTRQIIELSNLSVSSALRQSRSARYVIALNGILVCRFLTLSARAISPLRTLSLYVIAFRWFICV